MTQSLLITTLKRPSALPPYSLERESAWITALPSLKAIAPRVIGFEESHCFDCTNSPIGLSINRMWFLNQSHAPLSNSMAIVDADSPER